MSYLNYDILQIISGGTTGANTLVVSYTNNHGIDMAQHKPNWKQYGRGAGIIRNKTIVDNADMVIAFWDGTSKGTQSSINYAKKQAKPVVIINV